MTFAIVITTYQRKDGQTPFYLRRALNSVINQNYQDFKIIVIGDKYENDLELKTIMMEYGSDKVYFENLPFAKERDVYNDKTLVWLYGGCYANNYGIDKAIDLGYEYVCHLDHDDEWLPNHLSSLKRGIEETSAMWLCTKSYYTEKIILPKIDSVEYFIPFLPTPEGLIHSSTCINFKQIPLRHRNVFEETGSVGLPGDADLWNRMKEYFIDYNIKSILINELTCKHMEEGYERN